MKRRHQQIQRSRTKGGKEGVCTLEISKEKDILYTQTCKEKIYSNISTHLPTTHVGIEDIRISIYLYTSAPILHL